MGSGSSKGGSRECVTATASHDLLVSIGGHCDCADRVTLREVNQACRAAVRPAGFRVCGEPQLLELVKHALRASFFPKRLVLVGCPLTTTTAASMYALAHRLPEKSVELELELVGGEGHHELGIDAAVALSRRVKRLTLKLVGFKYGPHDLLSLCSNLSVRQCQHPATYCVMLYIEHLERLSLEDFDEALLGKELGKRPAPHLTELHILGVKPSVLGIRTLGFPPEAQLKRISVPAKWAEGQLLLDALDEPSCAGLERLCLVGDGDVVDISDLEDVLSAGNQSFELSMQDVYLDEPTENDWRALAKPALRRLVWDGAWEVHLDPATLPPSALPAFTWPRRLRAFMQSNHWAPPTVPLFRRLLRSLRRTFPRLEVLDMRCNCEDWTRTVATAVQQPLAEQEEARATLHDVIHGIRTAWPSKTVVLYVEPDHGALASFFPLTPEMRWVGTSVPPSDLVVACPGLHTLVGSPHAVAAGLGAGLGAVACLRLTAPQRPKPCGYEHGRIEDVTDALGEMSVRLELERRRDCEEWWSVEDVEDLDYEVVVVP